MIEITPDYAAREIFGSRCPYTDEVCTDWVCVICPVEQSERKAFEAFERQRKIEVTAGGKDK